LSKATGPLADVQPPKTASHVGGFFSIQFFWSIPMSKNLRELQARKAATVDAMKALNEKSEFTAEDQTKFDAHAADLKNISAAMDRESLLAANVVDLPRASASATVTVSDNRAADPKLGFQSFGEFAQTVRNAGLTGNRPDERLLIGAAAPGTYGNENAGADGGFLVPPEFSQSIFTHSLQEDSFLGLTDNTEVGGNSMVFPKDETTPWGTDGIRAYWQAEASVATATKPKISTSTLRLQKLMALVPLTDELLSDANALQSYLPGKVADSIRWKTNEAILFGTGDGQPLGALSGSAAITVAKETGQATATLQAINLANMIARLPAGSFQRAVWVINNDVLPSLFTLTLGNYPIYIPASEGMKGNPYGMLLGRPIIVSQHANTFSSQGDVQLHDLGYYRTITKAGGMQTATSMHLYFDADATAFRTTFRLDGAPKIAAPIQPAKGSKTLSPFVQLAAR
jgi:HK97 family phage major capsid protein